MSTELTGLFQDIDTGSEELAKEELSNGGGSSYVNDNGVFKGTIERCFITPTKKGGVALTLHTKDSGYSTTIYPVTVRDGKKVTTYTYKGKEQSLQDYKMLKQLYFVVTGKACELKDIKIEEQELTYKEYGKDVTVKAGVLVDLIGKEFNFGVRLEEQYNYEDGEIDKTSLKTNNNGDVVYKQTLFSVYSKSGKTAMELVKKEEAKQIEKDREFLASDKATKRVKLEIAEIEDDVVDNIQEPDEIDF